MNVVNLHGRLTKEPLIRKTQSGKDVAQFYLADVWASSFDFCGSKGTGSRSAQGEQSAFGTSVDDDIPF